MTPSVFVVDTNVLVAGLITDSPDSPVALILDAMMDGTVIYLLSPSLLEEYRTVLLRPRLQELHGLSEEAIDVLLVQLVANALWQEPELAAAAPDQGDDHIWALLESRTGSILITGDRLLLENPPVWSSVITPRTYVDRFLKS